MADLVVPGFGRWTTLDLAWLVEDGVWVHEGQLLANLCAEGRCAMFELRAPAAGLLRRFSSLVVTVSVGLRVGVIDGDVASLAREECAQLEALRQAAQPPPRRPGALAASLLSDDARAFARWSELVDARIETLRGR